MASHGRVIFTIIDHLQPYLKIVLRVARALPESSISKYACAFCTNRNHKAMRRPRSSRPVSPCRHPIRRTFARRVAGSSMTLDNWHRSWYRDSRRCQVSDLGCASVKETDEHVSGVNCAHAYSLEEAAHADWRNSTARECEIKEVRSHRYCTNQATCFRLSQAVVSKTYRIHHGTVYAPRSQRDDNGPFK